MPECTAEDVSQCYVPSPGIGHELGVLFGFIVLMLICMGTYAVVWQIGNKRSLRREQERVDRLRASGHLKPAEKSPAAAEPRSS